MSYRNLVSLSVFWYIVLTSNCLIFFLNCVKKYEWKTHTNKRWSEPSGAQQWKFLRKQKRQLQPCLDLFLKYVMASALHRVCENCEQCKLAHPKHEHYKQHKVQMTQGWKIKMNHFLPALTMRKRKDVSKRQHWQTL